LLFYISIITFIQLFFSDIYVKVEHNRHCSI